MMIAIQKDLWSRIEAFSLDAIDAEYPFSKRLARENNWTLAFAKRVVQEYKRFMFLAVVAGHEVTPSQEVDEAWHLHLIYTKSYWDEFCGKVLQKPIHHNPTKGGAAERKKYSLLYNRTLDSYRIFFNEEPPADIWQSEPVRFKKVAELKKINVRENWVIPKPKFLGASSAAVFTPIIMMLLTGCGGELFLFGGLAVAAGITLAFSLAKRPDEKKRNQQTDSGSSEVGIIDASEARSGDSSSSEAGIIDASEARSGDSSSSEARSGDSDEKSSGGFWSSFFGGGSDSSSDSSGSDSGGGDSSGCSSGCGGGD